MKTNLILAAAVIAALSTPVAAQSFTGDGASNAQIEAYRAKQAALPAQSNEVTGAVRNHSLKSFFVSEGAAGGPANVNEEGH